MIEDLLANNKRWSAERTAERPDYFERLSKLQEPDYLWIGCSDSRVPANVIAGLQPGQVFVHRNVANLVHPADLNILSVIEYAVHQLGVKHIIICGHYGCGGIRAAVSGEHSRLIDHWLQPVRDVADTCFECRECGYWSEGDLDSLCEASVVEQVRRLSRNPILNEAWDIGKDVSVHGWIYGLKDGLLSDLKCTVTGSTRSHAIPAGRG